MSADTTENQEAAQPPVGKSMRELRAILDADQKRWEQLADYWNDLFPSEQMALIASAREMAYANAPLGSTTGGSAASEGVSS
jgi:hypothetical protein